MERRQVCRPVAHVTAAPLCVAAHAFPSQHESGWPVAHRHPTLASFACPRQRQGCWAHWAQPVPAQPLSRHTVRRAGRRCPSPTAATTFRMLRTRSGGCTTGEAVVPWKQQCGVLDDVQAWMSANRASDHHQLRSRTACTAAGIQRPAGLRRASGCSHRRAWHSAR